MLGPKLREAAGLGNWQVVSLGPRESVSGKVVVLPDLSSVQGQALSEPTIIIAEALTGNEDIPVSKRVSRLMGSLCSHSKQCLMVY